MTSKTGKITLRDLQVVKGREPIACLTAYDAAFARLCDEAGADLILVGDSLGMIVQGRENTIGVSIDDMIYHSQCVTRVVKHAFVMADMPFMSAAVIEDALRNAAALMSEAHVSGVKIEFGEQHADTVRALSDNGIPVCAHIGLRPQWVHELGGFRKQGESKEEKSDLIKLANKAVESGAHLLLLEYVPTDIAHEITMEITEGTGVPVVGIGANMVCDGQILVTHDILGIGKTPHFAKDFLAETDGNVAQALKAYVDAVKSDSFYS